MANDLRERVESLKALRDRVQSLSDARDRKRRAATVSHEPHRPPVEGLDFIHSGADPRASEFLKPPEPAGFPSRKDAALASAGQVLAGVPEMAGATLEQAGRVAKKAAGEGGELPNPAYMWIGHRLERLGKAVGEMAPPPDPRLGTLGTVGRASGGSAVFMGGGAFGKLGVAGMGILANGYFESEAASQRALAKGATEEEAADAGWAAFARPWTVAAGASEIVPIAGIAGRIMGKADRASGGMVRRIVENAVKEGNEEFWQESAQQIVSILNENLDAEDVASWQEAVKRLGWDDLEEAAKSGAIGVAAVGPISVIGTAMAGRPDAGGDGDSGVDEKTPAPGDGQEQAQPETEGESVRPTDYSTDTGEVQGPELQSLPDESRELGPAEVAKRAAAEEKRARKLADSFGDPLPVEPKEPTPIVRPLKTDAEVAAEAEAESPEFQEFLRQQAEGEAPGLTGGSVAVPEPQAADESDPGVEVQESEPVAVEQAQEADVPRGTLPEDTTSIRNEQVDAELAEMGRPPATRGERTTFEAANKAAAETIASNPSAGQELVADLERKPRAVGPEEVAILTHERNRLRLRRQELEDARIAAHERGDAAFAEALGPRIDAVQADFIRASDVTAKVGTSTAQGLALRRMEIKADYSLANLERTMRAAQGGAPLSESQQAELQEVKSQLDDALKRIDRLERKRVRPRSRVGGAISKRADLARQRIQARRDGPTLLRSGTPSSEELFDYAIIGADYIARGIESFAAWSTEMVKELGESIRPHLQQVHEMAKQQLNDERIEQARASLEKSIANLTRKIEEGDLSTKSRGKVEGPGLDELREKRKQLIRELNKLRREATPKEERNEARLKAFKTRKANEARDILERLERGDLERTKREQLELDEEAIRLQAEAKKAKRKLNQAISAARRANRTRGEVVRDTLKEVLHEMPRSIISSADNSGFRQAITALYSHPFRTVARTPESMRAMFSQEFFDEHEQRLRSVDYFDEMIAAGVEFTSDNDELSQGEEEYGSRLVERIPVLGPIVKGSGRAFMTLLNSIRTDSYGYLRDSNFLGGETTREQREAIASFVNNSTGRGDGLVGKAASKIGILFWAPKLLASRINLLMGPASPTAFGRGFRNDPALRKLFLREYAQTIAGMAVMYGLMNAWLDGEDEGIEWDPRSSDFGKIRVGDTRVDPMGGLIQVTTLLSKVVAHQFTDSSVKSPTTGKTKQFTFEDIARFGRYKFSPSVSAATNLILGEDAVGNNMRPSTVEGATNLAASMYVPLPFREVHEAIRERGLPNGAALGALAFFGMGVQIFGYKTDFNAAAREVKAAEEGDPLYATRSGMRYTTVLRKAQARIADLTERGKLDAANKARSAFVKKVEDAKGKPD